MNTDQPRTMTVSQLIEHIKADNLEQSIAFQLSGVGYVQVKTRDCEEFETLLADSGDRPFMFTGRKEASEFVDNLVKETLASIGNPHSEMPELLDGISTTRKVY